VTAWTEERPGGGERKRGGVAAHQCVRDVIQTNSDSKQESSRRREENLRQNQDQIKRKKDPLPFDLSQQNYEIEKRGGVL